MKILLIIILISISAINLVSAQQLKVNAAIKGNTDSFITHSSNDSDYYMTVANSKNVYDKTRQINRNIDLYIQRKDKGGMLKAFLKVFSDERLKQLQPERALIMTMYLTPSGQIMEINFMVPKNTLLTANELEELEKSIKENVSFYIDPKQLKGQNFIDVTTGANYTGILNRTWN